MTIELSSLIFDVRDELSDIPEEYVDDKIIYKQIKLSYNYINGLCDTTSVDEDLLKSAIISLAAYYSYISYTSLSERLTGSIPQTAAIKLEVLRNKAQMFLQTVLGVPIKDDLTIDEDKLSGSETVTETSLDADELKDNI